MRAISEYRRALPAPPLRPLIAGYSGYREAGVPPMRHRGLPSPYLTLIFTLDDPLVIAAHPDPRAAPGRYDTLIGGLHTTPALITHDGRHSGVIVALSPLGARALLGAPAGVLASTDVPAGDVLGAGFTREVRERLVEATDWPARFAVLDELFLRRADGDSRPQPEVTRAWRRLVGTGGRVSVADLAREIGWSARHLGQRFAVEIGMSPKAAARMARFDRARRLLAERVAVVDRQPANLELARLAAVCGYADQAHLTREFGAFAGCSPGRWLRDEFRNVQAVAVASLADSAA